MSVDINGLDRLNVTMTLSAPKWFGDGAAPTFTLPLFFILVSVDASDRPCKQSGGKAIVDKGLGKKRGQYGCSNILFHAAQSLELEAATKVSLLLASSPGHSQILSRSCEKTPELRDKIWEWPGDEATLLPRARISALKIFRCPSALVS